MSRSFAKTSASAGKLGLISGTLLAGIKRTVVAAIMDCSAAKVFSEFCKADQVSFIKINEGTVIHRNKFEDIKSRLR